MMRKEDELSCAVLSYLKGVNEMPNIAAESAAINIRRGHTGDYLKFKLRQRPMLDKSVGVEFEKMPQSGSRRPPINTHIRGPAVF